MISELVIYYLCSVENSTRMPKSNGSVVGPGIPSIIPRFGPPGDMTTPLLGPSTPYTRLISLLKIDNFKTYFILKK